jgi:phosphomethylpyrimidine synthase
MSPGQPTMNVALTAARFAEESGTDTLQDVSIVGPLRDFKLALLKQSTVPVGTVLAYEVITRLRNHPKQRSIRDVVVDVITSDVRAGAGFVTVHASLSFNPRSAPPQRQIKIGSRAGAMLLRLCEEMSIENPLREFFDDILAVLAEYNTAISLGSYARSCSVLDALDEFALAELHEQSALALRAQDHGVPVLLEGLGHARIGDIRRYVETAKRLNPWWLLTALGPLPTDAALGNDHIAGAIGATIAALEGVSMVSVVTSSEHLAVPSPNQTAEAIKAARVASHAAAIQMGLRPLLDQGMSKHRADRAWSGMRCWAIDSTVDVAGHCEGHPCGVCGDECPLSGNGGASADLLRIRPLAFRNNIRAYPIEVQNCWWETLISLSKWYHFDFLSFGSVFVGDFGIKETPDGRCFMVSDFEFTLIWRTDPAPEAEMGVADALAKLNEKYGPAHLGFHVTAAIQKAEDFLIRLNADPWLAAAFRKTGRVVIGETDVLDRIPNANASIDRDPESLRDLLDHFFWTVLIRLDPRLGPRQRNLYASYCQEILIRSLCKACIPVAAMISGRWIGDIRDSSHLLAQSSISSRETSKACEWLINRKDRLRVSSTAELPETVRAALLVFDAFESIVKCALPSLTLLRKMLSEMQALGAARVETEMERRLKAAQELGKRGSHYAYAKAAYQTPLDE